MVSFGGYSLILSVTSKAKQDFARYETHCIVRLRDNFQRVCFLTTNVLASSKILKETGQREVLIRRRSFTLICCLAKEVLRF